MSGGFLHRPGRLCLLLSFSLRGALVFFLAVSVSESGRSRDTGCFLYCIIQTRLISQIVQSLGYDHEINCFRHSY